MITVLLGLLIAILIVSIILFGYLYSITGEKEYEEYKEDEKDKVELEVFSSEVPDIVHISGIPLLEEGLSTHIGVELDVLVINRTHTLPLTRVIKAQHLREYELVEEHKSVIKRALVGGILGPVGAVVGGISGVGTKKTEEIQHFLSIDFSDKSGNDVTALFLAKHRFLGEYYFPRFVDYLNNEIGYEDKKLIITEDERYEI